MLKKRPFGTAKQLLLDAATLTILQAAFCSDDRAVQAYQLWRSTVPLDDIDWLAFRVMPSLVRTARERGLEDHNTARMRGAARHIWVANNLRFQTLFEALDALSDASCRPILLKAAALCARTAGQIALGASGDYDILVDQGEARGAIEILIQAGFQPHAGRGDLFGDADFERYHATNFIKGGNVHNNIDLHWSPLPRPAPPGLATEVLSRSVTITFRGRSLRVPCWTDLLFLTLSRPAPWDRRETGARVGEALMILRAAAEQVEWDAFEKLVRRVGTGWIVAPILDAIQSDFGFSLPGGLVARIWDDAGPLASLELRLRGTPPYQSGGLSRAFLKAVEVVRHENGPIRLRHVLSQSGVRRRAWLAARAETKLLQGPNFLKAVWASWRAHVGAAQHVGPLYLDGFCQPEERGRWTEARVAVLAISPANAGEGPITVEMLVWPYFRKDARSFRFEIESGSGVTRSWTISRDEPHPARAVVEAIPVGVARQALIVLRLPEACSPAVVGGGDSRELGLFFDLGGTRAWFGETLELGDDGAYLRAVRQARAAVLARTLGRKPAFLEGFSEAEPNGRWTVGRVAVLAIGAAAPDREIVTVEMQVWPYFRRGLDHFKFVVESGLEHPGVHTVWRQDPRPMRLEIRVAPAGPHGAVLIVLHLPEATSPSSCGDGDDCRELGLFVSSCDRHDAVAMAPMRSPTGAASLLAADRRDGA